MTPGGPEGPCSGTEQFRDGSAPVLPLEAWPRPRPCLPTPPAALLPGQLRRPARPNPRRDRGPYPALTLPSPAACPAGLPGPVCLGLWQVARGAALRGMIRVPGLGPRIETGRCSGDEARMRYGA
jgi:hypothetical protein